MRSEVLNVVADRMVADAKGEYQHPRDVAKAKRALRVLALAAFPEYAGRKIRAVWVESVTLTDLNWSGGTKRKYRVVRMADGAVRRADGLGDAHPAFNEAEGATIRACEGFAIVCHSHFCGHDCGLTVYLPAIGPIESRRLPGM